MGPHWRKWYFRKIIFFRFFLKNRNFFIFYHGPIGENDILEKKFFFDFFSKIELFSYFTMVPHWRKWYFGKIIFFCDFFRKIEKFKKKFKNSQKLQKSAKFWKNYKNWKNFEKITKIGKNSKNPWKLQEIAKIEINC